MQDWVLARTKPLSEHLAARHVARVGGICYLPTFWDPKAKRRTVLFASYLFALVRDHSFAWLNSLPGILHVVHFGTHLAKVPEPVITALRSRENSHGNIVLPSQDQLAPGDRVRLTGGPLQGHLGLYQGMTTHDRICVLLTLLGAYVPTYLERELVERA